MDEETIVALATPPGRAGIAVVRLSGGQSEAIVKKIVRPLPERPKARFHYHGFVHDGDGRRIDECLAVLFRSPASYSGEDMAEISLHSNLFLVEEVIALACRGGARPALPGEFTYRAFRNGKLDLLQAEAVNELIQANSRAYSLMEFDNLEGRLSRTVGAVREALLRAAVDVETRIEFAEDQHLEAGGDGGALAAAGAALDRVLAAGRFAEALNNGLQVVIAGRINVGKSSLFNALLMKERSIISELPGTTRDYIQETLRLDGFAFRVTDMAGIRSGPGDDVEQQGMQRSLERIAQSDAAIFMVDASRPLEEADLGLYRRLAGKPRLLLANKSDLASEEVVRGIRAAFPGEPLQLVSAKTGENLEAVSDFLKSLLRRMPDASGAAAVNLRQRGLLERLRDNIGLLLRLQAQEHEPVEVVAEEIRRGLRLIGELTGAISADDILHGVFASFCIGK
jgi:tRNA modification GTPase